MELSNLVGQTLDSKYQIERELGHGGMGTVYLATHVGTERPVAVKVIAPQYMQRAEFVERFRREARAAGRLRHPNVVEVTDFGFTDIDTGRVAYLVMEYLDGCTLGEILEEEQNLPVGWTMDILEQVCSAVQEAHEQGIIHRDLKPDNIWLEPNQRGGYTVKVLDFGIAKLEAIQPVDTGEHEVRVSASNTLSGAANITFGGSDNTAIHDSISPTMLAEAATLAGITDASTVAIAPKTEKPFIGSEAKTAIFPTADGSNEDQETIGTQIISGAEDTDRSGSNHVTDQTEGENLATKDLTRVGAVLGTPLYMSPEQCSGRKLDARSDIYSLGVIAYQMLSGGTPFKGDFSKVMESHKFLPPPPLKAKKARKKLKRVIASALSKDPDQRPQTAEALTVIGSFCAYLIIGTISWIVIQSLAVPLRPIRIRASLKEARRNWKRFAGAGMLSFLLSVGIGIITCGLGFLVTSVLWTLLAPVVMMDNLKGMEALRRSKTLVKRSLATSIAAVALTFLIPFLSAGLISFVINITAKAVNSESSKVQKIANIVHDASLSPEEKAERAAQEASAEPKKDETINIGFGQGLTSKNKDMRTRVTDAVLESLLQVLLLPLQIITTSFTSIIIALLYLKTRLAGGESLQDLLSKFEETDRPRKKWQERVRQRLIQSGRLTTTSRP